MRWVDRSMDEWMVCFGYRVHKYIGDLRNRSYDSCHISPFHGGSSASLKVPGLDLLGD